MSDYMKDAIVLFYIPWLSFCWLIQSGMFGIAWRKLKGLPPESEIHVTAYAGATASFLAAAPVVAWTRDWTLIALWPSIFGAMSIGYLKEAMGLEKPGDYLWMIIWGAVVCLVAVAGTLKPTAVIVFGLGALAGPIYALNKKYPEAFGIDWTQRSEAMYGATLGVAVLLALVL